VLKVTCGDCVHGVEITWDVRWGMSQENREIVNVLERMGLDLGEFRYCVRLGFVESALMVRACDEWDQA
jgi:hypothetical protein